MVFFFFFVFFGGFSFANNNLFSSQVVEGVTALNPGPLMKKRGAGTFAALSIQPRRLTEEEREAAETPVGHMLYERARVDVVKI